MKVPSNDSVKKEIKKLLKRLNYYQKRVENNFITQDEYLIKIRPITRSVNILEVILAINTAELDLKGLKLSYFQLLQIGPPEEYFLYQIREGINAVESMDIHEKLMHQIKAMIVERTTLLKRSIKNIQLSDLMQEIIDLGEFDGND